MARGKKHTAEQVVNLLRQIEAGEHEAESLCSRSGFAWSGFACPVGKPCVLRGYLPLLDSIHKSKIDAVSQLLALLPWMRCKV